MYIRIWAMFRQKLHYFVILYRYVHIYVLYIISKFQWILFYIHVVWYFVVFRALVAGRETNFDVTMVTNNSQRKSPFFLLSPSCFACRFIRYRMLIPVKLAPVSSSRNITHLCIRSAEFVKNGFRSNKKQIHPTRTRTNMFIR